MTRTESTTPGRDLIEQLKRSRPDVAITVSRGLDPDPQWLGDPSEDPEADGQVCYEHTVTARCIQGGEVYEGTAYIGCSWYPPDEDSDTLREVSGYLPGMVAEALKELDQKLAARLAYQWKCDQQ